MAPQERSRTQDAIVGVVLEILESGGYDAVQLREVARRARVSLATIYKAFPTREALLVTAVEQWMQTHCYVELALPAPDETLHDGLMRVFGYVFEPWERHPRMLEAYHRARTGPGGDRLDAQAREAIEPVALAVLDGTEPAYFDDIAQILTNVAYALVGRYASGALEITAILPALDQVVTRLTGNNAPAAAAAVAARKTAAAQRTPR